MSVKYDQHYRDDPAACGNPFPELVAFAEAHGRPGLRVLDLGCGQGRDALTFARRGCHVTGVDVSAVGAQQLQRAAAAEGVSVDVVVADIRTWGPSEAYPVVILDRVLHMIADDDERRAVLDTAMAATSPGGHVLVADGPSHCPWIGEVFAEAGWCLVTRTRHRVFAQRPENP